MQIRTRNASLVRRSIACSFNFSQAPGRRLRKVRDCSQDRGKSNCIPWLGQRGQKTIPYLAARPRIAQIRKCPPPGDMTDSKLRAWLCRGYHHIKRSGMLTVSLEAGAIIGDGISDYGSWHEGINKGLWSHLGCSWKKATICNCQIIF